ncbi:MAG: hypothetical protein ACJ739_02190 [Acidimicrobiales bacterium]
MARLGERRSGPAREVDGIDVLDRLASAPLWAHASALLVALFVLLPVVGTSASYSADEGAAIIQARSLADGDGWIIPHPVPEVDPTGKLYPLELSLAGPKGAASYGKHPAYPVVLAAADRLGGVTAMVSVSLLATWVAALAAAALATRVAGGLARTALWVAGLGSPLLFNGYWVIAHTLGAAAIAWAVVAVVDGSRPGRRAWVLAAAPLLVAIATLLRTEAALYGIGLALVAAGWGIGTRRPLLVVTGAATGIAVAAARAIDSVVARRIVGEPLLSRSAFDPRPAASFLSERLDGLTATWLRPAPPGDSSLAGVLVLVAAVLVLVAAVCALRARPGPAVVLAGGAAVLLAVPAIALPAIPVPGLLFAFPILVVGAIGALGHPVVVDRRSTTIVLGTLLVGWAGVLATQYAEGGVTEWGGRYFAVGLPLTVPLVLVGVRALLVDLPPASARGITVALGVILLALSAVSLRELREVHEDTRDTFALIDATADRVGPRPVVVTDVAAAPRLDWANFDDHRWLLVDPDAEADLPAALADAGIERWVLVSGDVDHALEAFDDLTVVEQASPSVVVVERRRP